MRNFQDTFETPKQSFIGFFSICMIVLLSQPLTDSTKTTSVYQIDIIHPTLHSIFQTVAADRQING